MFNSYEAREYSLTRGAMAPCVHLWTPRRVQMDFAALIATSIAASLTGLGFAYFLMRRTVAAVAITARRNRHSR